jgi:hypothetical protein
MKSTLRFAVLIPFFLLTAGAAAQTVTSDRYQDVNVLMDLHTPGGGTEAVELVGICTTQITWDGIDPGTADDSDGDGRDDVPIEIVALSLTGSSSLGRVTMTLNAAAASLGEIEEDINITPDLLDLPPYTPPSGSTADSFFDVYVEVDLDGNRTHNQEPVRMTGHLSSLPAAHTDDLAGVGLVPLYDENNEPTGITLGVGRWTLNPIVETDVFDSANAAITIYDPMGLPHMVALAGQARVDVFFTGDAEGFDDDSDGDGLDDANMKLVMLDLTGFSSAFGDVSMALYAWLPSLGAIEETANMDPGRLDLPPFAAGGTAESFFDVFTEITIVGVGMHNTSPLRVNGPVTYKPVGEDDTLTGSGIAALYDGQGTATGFNLSLDELQLGPLATGVSDDSPPDVRVSALRVAPNPFNPATRIFFDLAAARHVRAAVYDPTGRLVATLADRRFEAGANVLDWQGRDDNGRAMPSGVYLVRMITGTTDLSGRLVLVR